jgi:hypothetical protein
MLTLPTEKVGEEGEMVPITVSAANRASIALLKVSLCLAPAQIIALTMPRCGIKYDEL